MQKNILIAVIAALLSVQFWACRPGSGNDILTEGKNLISLADETFEVSSQEAREYAQKALEYALEHNDAETEAKAYFQLARTYFATNEFDTAIEYAKFAEQLLLTQNDNYTLASLYNTLSNGYFMMRDDENSTYYSEKAIEFAELSNNLPILIVQYYMRAVKFTEKHESFFALQYLLKALEYDDGSKEVEKPIQRCYSFLGQIYKDFGIIDKALYFYNQAIRYSEKEGLNRQLIYLYHNLSFVYTQLGLPDSAFNYCKKSLEIAETTNLAPLKAISYRALAEYYSSINQTDSAKYYIKNAIKLAESINYHNICNFYFSAGNIYYELGDYDKALYYGKETLELAISANNPKVLLLTQKLIADIYNKIQMYEFASSFYNQYILGDTLIKKNHSLIQEDLIRVAEEEIYKQSQSRINEMKANRNMLLFILLICTCFIGILIFTVRLLVKQRNKIHTINKELNDHKDELELLVDYKSKLLNDKELQYTNLCNNMFNGAIFRMEFNINDISGNVIFLSSGWKNLTGQNENGILFLDENVFPADKDHLFNSIAKAVQSCSILDTSFRYYKNQEIVWFHVRAEASKSTENHVFLDGYLVDDTDQKRIEEILFKAKEKAEESDRLKTAFLNNISHEIRTPMNGIVGFSNLIINDQIPEDEKQTFLKAINDNCYQLLQIISDIVELSKIETGQLHLNITEISLNEIEKEILQYIFPVYKEKYPSLEFMLDSSFKTHENTKLKIDKTCLQMVFEYLIANAGKFTREGQVIVGIIPENNNVTFFVKDTGIGIEAQYYETIFDNFTKLDPQMNSGTGLGLPIVKRLIAKMNGKIWVESEINSGSTFYFSLSV